MNLDQIKIIPLLDTLEIKKIPDSLYFSKEYKDYISNSRLGILKKDGPKSFFEGIPFQSSPSLEIGSAVHELVLQGDLFHLCFDADRPTSKAGIMADELYPIFSTDSSSEERLKAIYAASDKVSYYKGMLDTKKIELLLDKCAPYWKQRKSYESKKLDSTPIYLDVKSRETVQQCVHALERNSYIQTLLHPKGYLSDPISKNEQAILLNVQIQMPENYSFVFKLKSKLDNFTIDLETNEVVVNDVKTIGKLLSEFQNNFTNFAYYRELSMYSWLLSLVCQKIYGITPSSIKANCLVVSTIPNYYTKVYKLTKADFTRGWEEFKYLLRWAAHYYSKGFRFD